MKKLFYFLFLTSFSLSAQTQYTLNQCIETAWTNNLQVKQSALQLQSAEMNFNQSKNNKLPTVNGNYNFGINNGRSIDPFTNGYINEQLSSSNASINANYVVYNGGRLQSLIKQNSFLWQAGKADVQQEKDNLSLNVMLAYLQVLNNEDLLKLAQTQVEVTKKQVERLDILNKNGALQPALLYDMKGQFATDELGVINVQNALESSKLNLLQLMNVPYNKDIQLEKMGEKKDSREGGTSSSVLTPYEASAKAIYNEAIAHLAVVKAAEFRQQSASIGVKVSESNYYPTVSLFGQLGTNYSSAAQLLTETGKSDVPTNNFVTVNSTKYGVFSNATSYASSKINYFNQFGNNLNSFVGVNVQIPIFNAFQTKTRVGLSKIQEQSAAVATDNIKRQLYQAIEQAHLNMQATYNRYTVINQQVDAFQRSFNAAETRFTEGVIHSVDYLIVKNNLDRAKANLVNTYYDYLLRIKVLDFYRGK
jgi:outer membrane protein